MTDKEKIVYKLHPKGRDGNSLMVLGFQDACSHLEAMVEDVGCDPVVIEPTDMTEEEYNGLPIHNGW